MTRANGPVTVCVINLKGGVGKSTISALVARRGYTYRKLDVLAIDLDPQAKLSQGLMHSDYNNFLIQKRPSIVEVFNGYIHRQPPQPLHLLHSPQLAVSKQSQRRVEGRFNSFPLASTF